MPKSPSAGEAPSAGSRLRENNASVYRERGIAAHYGGETLLTRAEAVVLLKYQPAFAGKEILDIGVGGGRTAIYLAPLAGRYQAIDYSPAMVARFRELFPGVPVTLADMADLRVFDTASFDFVFASNNVFDAVGHEDRLLTLRGIHRVLRPGGMLIFSSHNRDVRDAMRGPRLAKSRNPVTQMQNFVHWGISWMNYVRLRRSQTITDDYAIINDDAHDRAMLHYYIGPDEQSVQLAAANFRLLEILDHLGNPVTKGDHASHSRSLVYIAERSMTNAQAQGVPDDEPTRH